MHNHFTNAETAKYLTDFYNKFKSNKNNLSSLFANNPNRSQEFSIDSLNCHLDFSKNWIDKLSFDLLEKMADESNLADKIDAMFSGQNINITEGRAVLHTALRNFNNTNKLNGTNLADVINHTQSKIKSICQDLKNKKLTGFSGKPINTIVNIGIGGSDLGPKMVYNALKPYWNEDIKCHFVSNIDPSDIYTVLNNIDADQTLFIIASKSFTTSETLANAETARNWLLKYCEFDQLKNHFIGITNSVDKATTFGINQEQILPMWDWVGGRYSLWSAIGLIIALGTSYKVYEDLLNGAHDLDLHFKSKPWHENMPVVLALLGVAYINFAGAQSHALLPYCQNLDYFTNYIQQLDMESNGKSVNLQEDSISYSTGPIIWGSPGTNGQHAFHQLLHQGTHIVPCDFIVPINSDFEPKAQQQALVANAFAQSRTLLEGYNKDKDIEAYRVLAGNKPSTTLLLPKLTPYYLGILIALYEHKVFTQGVIWNINSFDQWGVERGKVVANEIISYLNYTNNNNQDISFDGSTLNLLDKYKELITTTDNN